MDDLQHLILVDGASTGDLVTSTRGWRKRGLTKMIGTYSQKVHDLNEKIDRAESMCRAYPDSLTLAQNLEELNARMEKLLEKENKLIKMDQRLGYPDLEFECSDVSLDDMIWYVEERYPGWRFSRTETRYKTCIIAVFERD